MLYHLFQYLEQYDIPGARMFGYVSFRSLMAIILALLISAIFGEYFINLLRKKQISETQRDASIDPFNVNKVGVPTMGGVIIIIAIIIPCLLLGKLTNVYMILMLITTVWLGTLGFLDDYIKVFKKDKEGLHGKFKIIGQVGLGLIVGLTLYLSPDVVIRENIEIQRSNQAVEVILLIVEFIHQILDGDISEMCPDIVRNLFEYDPVHRLLLLFGKRKIILCT